MKPNLKQAILNHVKTNLHFEIYPQSINETEAAVFCIARRETAKALFVASAPESTEPLEEFQGEFIDVPDALFHLKKCPLQHENARAIQQLFPFTQPQLLGTQNSFGFGDRLGLANPAHLRALEGSDFKPIVAQQSIRELERTQRTPEEVMDAAVWAVFQEGYKSGFGADADHLKKPEDIDLMVRAGFCFFTIDPSDFIHNEVDSMTKPKLLDHIQKLDWELLQDTPQAILQRYDTREFKISDKLTLRPAHIEVLRSIAKYGGALGHIKNMGDHLKTAHPDFPAEVECSIDETDSVTSPFDHFFIVNELRRLKVEFVSLAPRFIGAFEKGIDYKGDIDLFREEFIKHQQIVAYFGNYKISLHSGSDKFRVYKTIGKIGTVPVHVKTAGTSYLEALKVIAIVEPDFFREILDFSRDCYEDQKRSYHVSADLGRVRPAAQYSNRELTQLFHQDDARQVLHVSFGKVLTYTDADGNYNFRDRILDCLRANEALHYQLLVEHFQKHLQEFKST